MRKPRQHREGVVTCPSLGRRGAGQESKRCTQWTCLVRARSLSLSLSLPISLSGAPTLLQPYLRACSGSLVRKRRPPGEEVSWDPFHLGLDAEWELG